MSRALCNLSVSSMVRAERDSRANGSSAAPRWGSPKLLHVPSNVRYRILLRRAHGTNEEALVKSVSRRRLNARKFANDRLRANEVSIRVTELKSVFSLAEETSVENNEKHIKSKTDTVVRMYILCVEVAVVSLGEFRELQSLYHNLPANVKFNNALLPGPSTRHRKQSNSFFITGNSRALH